LKHSFIPTNGIKLHVVHAGPEDGPVVILLRGFPEFWYGWRKQIPFLAKSGFRVLTPDQRGYNLSDKPAGIRAYHLDQLAADIIGLAPVEGKITHRARLGRVRCLVDCHEIWKPAAKDGDSERTASCSDEIQFAQKQNPEEKELVYLLFPTALAAGKDDEQEQLGVCGKISKGKQRDRRLQ
jgi:hypothetical protein